MVQTGAEQGNPTDGRLQAFDSRPRTSNNEDMAERARKQVHKRAQREFRGYPVASVALYGPDDTTATKLTVGIVPAKDVDVTDLRRWFSEGADIRNDAGVAEELLAFLEAAGARSIAPLIPDVRHAVRISALFQLASRQDERLDEMLASH